MQATSKESVAWLFPLTYLIHLSEEFWGGEGFPSWISRLANADFTNQDFLVLNGIGFTLMTIAALLIYRQTWRWLLIALSGVVFINGALHLIINAVTWTYSPGVISGVLCWMPLGVMTIYRQWMLTTRRSRVIGIMLAVGLHVIISALAVLG